MLCKSHENARECAYGGLTVRDRFQLPHTNYVINLDHERFSYIYYKNCEDYTLLDYWQVRNLCHIGDVSILHTVIASLNPLVY